MGDTMTDPDLPDDFNLSSAHQGDRVTAESGDTYVVLHNQFTGERHLIAEEKYERGEY